MELVLQQTADAAAIGDARAQLAAARDAVAEREAALTQLRALMRGFESRYLGAVAVLYAELDELEARITEREVDLYDSASARARADAARQRAEETRASVDAAAEPDEPAEVDAPPGLKTLFREVARRIHPDYAADEADRSYRTLLMARANAAYGRGDGDALLRMLDDQREVDAAAGEDAAAELARLARQLGHAERDLLALAAEERELRASEIGLLYADNANAEADGRDLVAELAAGLHAALAEAQHRLEFVGRQVEAQRGSHGD